MQRRARDFHVKRCDMPASEASKVKSRLALSGKDDVGGSRNVRSLEIIDQDLQFSRKFQPIDSVGPVTRDVQALLNIKSKPIWNGSGHETNGFAFTGRTVGKYRNSRHTREQ